MSARAAREPAVNAWLGGLLGRSRCDTDPAELRGLAPGTALSSVARRARLQPLDLVAMLADGFDSAVAPSPPECSPACAQPTPPDQAGRVGRRRAANDGDGLVAHRFGEGPAWGRHTEHHGLRAAVGGGGLPALARRIPPRVGLPPRQSSPRPQVTNRLADRRYGSRRLVDSATADALTLAQLLSERLGPIPRCWRATRPCGSARCAVGCRRIRHPSIQAPGCPRSTSRQVTDRGSCAARAARRVLARSRGVARGGCARAGLWDQGRPPPPLSVADQGQHRVLQSTEVASRSRAAMPRGSSPPCRHAGPQDPRASGCGAKDLLGDGSPSSPRGLDPVRVDLQRRSTRTSWMLTSLTGGSRGSGGAARRSRPG